MVDSSYLTNLKVSGFTLYFLNCFFPNILCVDRANLVCLCIHKIVKRYTTSMITTAQTKTDYYYFLYHYTQKNLPIDK